MADDAELLAYLREKMKPLDPTKEYSAWGIANDLAEKFDRQNVGDLLPLVEKVAGEFGIRLADVHLMT